MDRRAELLARLEQLDEGTLEALVAELEGRPVSRRTFLSRGARLASGAALLGVGVWGASREVEVLRLKGLLRLYEELEEVGLDGLLETGSRALALPLAGLEAGARALKEGLDWAEGALLDLQGAFAGVRAALAVVEGWVERLQAGVERVWRWVGQGVDRARPLTEPVAAFLDRVLGLLPFGIGQEVREGLRAMADLVATVPQALDALQDRVLEPLRTRWFSEERAQNLEGRFLEPLRTRILDPLEAHLDAVADALAAWERELRQPMEAALERRAEIRRKIEAYRREYGL